MTCSKSIFLFVLTIASSGAWTAQGGGLIVPLQVPTIQQAIDDPITLAGDEIVVAPGTNNEVITFSSKAIMLRSTAPTLLPVPGSETIFGDSTGATGPDVYVNPGEVAGNIWWISFEIAGRADVILDMCGTSPVPSGWFFLTQCDDDGVGCSDFVVGDFFDHTTCGDGNITLRFSQLPSGTYYYPITFDPDQEGPFQVNISTTLISDLGSCCTAAEDTCTDDVEEVDCSADGQEFTRFGRCCELECRDPAGPEYDSFGVALLSRVSIEDFATFAGTPGNPHMGNEVWGYTSPSGREYAIMGFTTGTGYVDVTDPGNPVILEFINDGVNSIWRDMAIFGEYAYVVAGSGLLELMIVDLADIDAGNVTVVKTTDVGLGLTESHNVYINAASATLYLPLSNLNSARGLTALSLTDPLNPALVGTWTDTNSGVRCHDVQVVTYTCGPNAGKEIAFCFAEGNGLKIVDVTDKTAMFTLSTLTYPNLVYCHQGWLSDDGQYLIFGDELDEGSGGVAQMRTLVADVSVLTAPTLAGTFESDSCSIDHNQMVRRNLVFQANYSTGLHVLDFSSPPTLTQIAQFDTHPEDNVTDFLGAWGVFTDYASGIVVLSDRQRGLFVFDNPDLEDGCDFTGGDLYVATSGKDALSGITTGCAKQTIQAAIDAATNGDVIVVGPGTYDENINFNGKAITVRGACGPVATTIDAGGSGSVVTCTNGETSDTVLDGFTITGGDATNGGGMRNDSGSPTVTNCTFRGNTAASDGGGMYNFQSSNPTVTNCTFSGNSANGGSGGGMYNNDQSSPTVTNCTFSANMANTGGGMFNDVSSSPTVTNSILWGDGPDEISGTPTVSFSNVGGGFIGTGNINADPMFVDADGPDDIFGTEDDDLRLAAASPCIDAADNMSVPVGIVTDLDSNPRFFDVPATLDTGIGTPPIVDMGAYEFLRDCNSNGIPDECDLDCGVDGDPCDVLGCGQSADCNENGVTDECELDSDGDGVIDFCDICPGGDDFEDSDGDQVPDFCDVCPGGDDTVDGDGDGVADFCDPCPVNNPDDSDGDGICDREDTCPGGDDFDDADGDHVPDFCDLCPGGDDHVDNNGNGIPDECDLEPPTLAPPPHDTRKNRYISIDPRGTTGNNPNTHHIRVTLDSTEVLGVDVGQVGSVWWANDPDANCISLLGPSQPLSEPNWGGCPVVHLTGCPIIPTTTYSLASVSAGGYMSDPLVTETQLLPVDNKWWGDAVGSFTGSGGIPPNVWTAPQGTANFDDVTAALKTFLDPNAVNATHTSVTDIHPNRPDLGGTSVHPNRLVNINDVFAFIKAFQGEEYLGGDLASCTDP